MQFVNIPLDELMKRYYKKIQKMNKQEHKNYLNKSIAQEMFYLNKIANLIKNNIPFKNWDDKDKKILALACSCPIQKSISGKKGLTFEQKKAMRLLSHLIYRPKSNPKTSYLLSYAKKISLDELEEINHIAESIRANLRNKVPKFGLILVGDE